jgi:hypothetical protein
VQVDEVARLAESLAGVRGRTARGLVVRQLDDAHVVIRADFDYRDLIVRQHPATFSVPAWWARHMMVVSDLADGDPGAIERAWQLQRSAG